MGPLNPLTVYRNRIDILKRLNMHPRHVEGDYKPTVVYKLDSAGSLTRQSPKQPSKYALRKNTKRARKYAEAQKV